MNRKLIVTFDKSSNGDMPVLVVATESFGLIGNTMNVINTIVGDKAVRLYNELVKNEKN